MTYEYEYAITAGPGTLLDVGEIDLEGYMYSYMWGSDYSRDVLDPRPIVPKLFAREHLLRGHTILIGPIEYEGSGETIRIKGDE